ncbi:hypothetical protein ACWEKT_20185 [Nocardia takedensis]|uniref:hypothetical protein n=1 Tax=Nocardia takedensis TaxID=259390 RepID=UPI000313CAA3|nr:hypothetical protein [Nocardia takedensis]
MAWNINSATEKRRHQAALAIHHISRAGYIARLNSRVEQHRNGGTEHDYTDLCPGSGVVILTEDAPRFSATQLAALTTRSLIVLRQRFDAAEAAILAHFDPSSDHYTH